ncbi:MAG: hypothetical protein M3O70_22180 [Actinomycetota bacterium]|nr:hypothetical protein [Actinomycetota bacterium]
MPDEEAAAQAAPPGDEDPGPGPFAAVRPVDLRDYAAFDRGGARRVRVFATDVITLDLWCLEPWQDTPVLHYEDVDVVYTVIGGNTWFATDQGELGLGPLGAILVPSGVAHAIGNRTADPVIVLASASPPDVPGGRVTTDEPVERTNGAVYRPGGRPSLADRVRRLIGTPPERS